ncbi:MAG: hypothetical protein V7727_22370, partial [Sneathiella sp.]
MRLVKADAAVIIRTSKADNITRYIARSDMQKGKIWPSQPLSYVADIVGEFIASAKVGSIWKMSDAVLSDFSRIPCGSDGRLNHLVEGIVSPLESTRG